MDLIFRWFSYDNLNIWLYCIVYIQCHWHRGVNTTFKRFLEFIILAIVHHILFFYLIIHLKASVGLAKNSALTSQRQCQWHRGAWLSNVNNTVYCRVCKVQQVKTIIIPWNRGPKEFLNHDETVLKMCETRNCNTHFWPRWVRTPLSLATSVIRQSFWQMRRSPLDQNHIWKYGLGFWCRGNEWKIGVISLWHCQFKCLT